MKLATVIIASTVAFLSIASITSPVSASSHPHHLRGIHRAIPDPFIALFKEFEHHFNPQLSIPSHKHGISYQHFKPIFKYKHNVSYKSGGGQECGQASWYSLPGRRMANGERMNPGAMAIAHKYLPFGTRVKIIDQNTGNSIVAKVSDRGPFIHGRIADLSPAAAHALGMNGLANICLYKI